MNEENYEALKKINRDLSEIAFKFSQIADLDGGKLVAGVVNELSEKLDDLSHFIYNVSIRKE